MGQGVLTNNFSQKTKNFNRGLKNDSIKSPYSLENAL
jgi:hypothetical protein